MSRLDVVPALAGRAAYDPGPAPAVPRLRLDRNEGPPPAGAAGAALAGLDPEAMRRYPDAAAVERRLAARAGLEPAQVLVTGGGDEAIDRCCRLMLAPGRRGLVHVPTFEMIERSAELAGAAAARVPWTDGPFPAGAMLDAAAAAEAAGEPVRLVALVTPNNPTGLAVPVADVRRIAGALPRALILVDAAYVEFDDPSLPAAVLGPPNVVVVRTFSKAWGLAGLRCGWVAGPAEVVAGLRAAGGPYSVTGATLAAVGALLEAGVEPDPCYLARVARERTALAAAFRAAGASVPDSRANFVTPLLPDAARAAAVADALAADGIAVRRFGGDRAAALRITCPGSAADWRRLAASLGPALGVEIDPRAGADDGAGAAPTDAGGEDDGPATAGVTAGVTATAGRAARREEDAR